MADEILGDYDAFIKAKAATSVAVGFDAKDTGIDLFDFQRAIVEWACRRGRAAIFADTGLGKTAMQTEWARQVNEHTGGDVLIAAPLCVAQQTVEEAAKFGIHVRYCRDQKDAKPGNKYAPIFTQLKVGQCLKCKTEDVGRIGNAIRKWIENNQLPYTFRVMRRYHSDGQGRVWLLPAPEKAEGGPKLKKVA